MKTKELVTQNGVRPLMHNGPRGSKTGQAGFSVGKMALAFGVTVFLAVLRSAMSVTYHLASPRTTVADPGRGSLGAASPATTDAVVGS